MERPLQRDAQNFKTIWDARKAFGKTVGFGFPVVFSMHMPNLFFILGISIILGGLYLWGFCHLSKERWQFIATIPVAKSAKGYRHGLNLTCYGLFNACVCTFAVLIVYILLSSIAMPLWAVHAVLLVSLAPSIPAAKLVARWVEKKAHTFSIGGAGFVGFVITPWSLMLLNQLLERWAGLASSTMLILAVIYALLLSILLPAVPFSSSVTEGLRQVWNPSIIISCQILWIGIFLYMGRSQVTGSRIFFYVRQDRI